MRQNLQVSKQPNRGKVIIGKDTYIEHAKKRLERGRENHRIEGLHGA